MKKHYYFTIFLSLLFAISIMLPSIAGACCSSLTSDFYISSSSPKKVGTSEQVGFINDACVSCAGGTVDKTLWKVNGTTVLEQSGKQNLNYSFSAGGDQTVYLKVWDYGFLWDEIDDDTMSVHVFKNKYPIVLVHGFAGWGREEVSLNLGGGITSGIRYWGGLSGDLESEMNNRGFEIFTASVGPITSAWDRACELYSEITGYNVDGKVDYGYVHAANSGGTDGNNTTFTHKRYANAQFLSNSNIDSTTKRLKNTKGHIIPAAGPSNPIHIVSHSYGGLTARALAYLLSKGTGGSSYYAEEIDDPNDASDQVSPLFTGGKSGTLRSVTAIATPINGTNLTYVVSNLLGLLDDFGVKAISGLTQENVTNALSSVYSLDVDQWQPSGIDDALITFDSDSTPCSPAPAIKDISLWDLSPCSELNQYATAESDIYYFSVACEETYKDCNNSENRWWSEYAPPWICIWPGANHATYHGGWMMDVFVYQTDQMGKPDYTTSKGLTDAWKESDGVVNTISEYKAACDQFISAQQNGTDKPNAVSESQKTPAPGKWVNVALLHEDHMDAIGGMDVWDIYGEESFSVDWDADGDVDQDVNIYDFYENLFEKLWDLPKFSS
ncbi:MAG: hypothetical protein HQK76_08290 [Desulfobacterales bacterium]|nr:hypothetical protein [Desulfobacterales bacterium]